ncbi:MAG: hypothetical protein M3067_05965 [Chloroflexota bacterium]|nr:hypothetical protein [Chloroflexota bacterium]
MRRRPARQDECAIEGGRIPLSGAAPLGSSPSRSKRWFTQRGRLLDLAVFAWYLVLTGVYLWPVLRALDAGVPHSIRDPGFQATVLHDVTERLLHLDIAHLFDASFFYPAHLTLAMADAQIGLQPIALPLHLAGLDALVVLNILTVLSFPVTALAADALGRYLTGARVGGLVVGSAFAFSAFRFEHVIHLQLLQSWTIPLAFLGLEMTLRERSRRGPILWAISLVAAATTSLNYLLLLAIAQPAYVAVRYLLASRRRDVIASVRRLVRPGAIAAAAIFVLLVPYALLRLEGYGRSLSGTFDFSARAVDYLVPAADSLALHGLYALHPPKTGIDERELFPGAIVLAAAVVGPLLAVARRERPRLRRMAPWLSIAGLAFVFSLGPYLWPDTAHPPASLSGLLSLPYRFLARPLLLESLRSPARFGVIVLLVVAILGAMAIVRGLARLPRGLARSAAITLLALGLAIEYSVSIPIEPVAWGAGLPATYGWLRDQPPGPVVELPALGVQVSYYMLASTADGHPRLNGWSGFLPRDLKPIAMIVTAGTLPGWLSAAHRLGATYVVVHGEAVDAATLAAVHASRAAGYLVPVATFGTDEVYRFGPSAPPPTSMAP